MGFSGLSYPCQHRAFMWGENGLPRACLGVLVGESSYSHNLDQKTVLLCPGRLLYLEFSFEKETHDGEGKRLPSQTGQLTQLWQSVG